MRSIFKKIFSLKFFFFLQKNLKISNLFFSLYNYQRIDPSKPITFSNLKLVRSFAGTPSEHGFILVHVAMVSHSGNLVRYTMETLESTQDQVKINKFDFRNLN